MQQIPVRTVSTTTGVGGKIHVRLTRGRFQNIRRLISGPLLLAFFALVWIEQSGQPWLLFDFGARRIHLFGATLAWHDLPLLAGLMIAGTCLLFFMAVAWGRVWCGFACPQSIWSWLFIRIEDLVEGRAAQRRRQHNLPLTGTPLARRVLKHSLWLFLALATALTFTGYFIPIRMLIADLISLQAGAAPLGWLICMTLLTYLNAGLVREKVCFHMCPYARFQGVMFDDNTRTVSYDSSRGEPRHARRQESPAATAPQAGDCVDCGLCVQVCPTGIDIRDGLQYECIDCAACIDACDAVMARLKRPEGLIAFRSNHQLAGRPSPLLRARLLGYGAVLLFSSLAVIAGFYLREPVVLEVLRDRHTLSWTDADGALCNSFLVKVEVIEPDVRAVQLNVELPGTLSARGPDQLYPDPEGMAQAHYQLCARAGSTPTREAVSFVAVTGDRQIRKEGVFLSSLQ